MAIGYTNSLRFVYSALGQHQQLPLHVRHHFVTRFMHSLPRIESIRPSWKAIEADAPEVTIRSAQFIGEGWTAVAYRVNDDLVFKFPKRREEWKDLESEIAFLAHAGPLLPLPVPEHLYQVRESAGAPFGYAVYRHIPGAGVDPGALSSSSRASLARTLAKFLRALHDMKPGPIATVLPREDRYRVAMEASEDAEKLAAQLTGAERRTLFELFRAHVEEPQATLGRSRILHADFSADHVLCVDDSVTGVIDWGDVCLGDPDYDFGYLYEELGEAFVCDMAVHYEHPDPDRLIRKARYFTLVDQIGTILYGAERALPGDVEESWRRLRSMLQNQAL
jgi:aminoglycoside 2''-phosphotransferase